MEKPHIHAVSYDRLCSLLNLISGPIAAIIIADIGKFGNKLDVPGLEQIPEENTLELHFSNGKKKSSIGSLTEEQAELIVGWTETLLEDKIANEIIICSPKGFQRSPAVAAAIDAKVNGHERARKHWTKNGLYLPNPYVAKTLLEAFRKVQKEELLLWKKALEVLQKKYAVHSDQNIQIGELLGYK